MLKQLNMSQAITNTLNTISNQLQNLINLYVVKFINTGDRVVDGAITIVINSLVALFGAYIYTNVLKLYHKIHATYVIKELDEPTAINHRRFPYDKYTVDAIINYPYVVKFDVSFGSTMVISFSHLIQWCVYQYKDVHNLEKTAIGLIDAPSTSFYNNNNNINVSNLTCLCSGVTKYFMPIWKYKNIQNEWEYIWLYDKYLYANDREQIARLTIVINKWKESITLKTTNNDIFIPYLFVLDSDGGGVALITRGKLNPKRTFDTLYFDEKPHIINMLGKLATNTLYPTGLSLDSKLGILLYGPTGTGKTGTIAAIANHLKRHVIMVKTLNKETIEYLSKMNDCNMYNYKNCIIVFDEFDHILCQKPAHMIYGTDYKIRRLQESLLYIDDADEKKKVMEEIQKIKKGETGDFNMSDLLTFLDGMNDSTGRIIIATTNHPNKINKDLLRAGRFDMKLELSYCSMQMFKDTVATRYPDDIANLENDDALQTRVKKILTLNITPLTLINTIVKTTTFDDLLSQLEALPQCEPFTATIAH